MRLHLEVVYHGAESLKETSPEILAVILINCQIKLTSHWPVPLDE